MKDGVDLRAIVAFEGDGLGNYRLVMDRFCLSMRRPHPHFHRPFLLFETVPFHFFPQRARS